MFCKRCGKEIENNVAFCEHCGCPTAESVNIPAAPVKQSTDGLGIASMVLGIISLVSCGSAFVLGIVGIVLGIVSLTQRGRSGSTSVYPIVGIATSATSILLFFAFIILVIIGAIAEDVSNTSLWF